MASTTLTVLAVLAAVAFASAQYPYMLYNFVQPAGHPGNVAVHPAYQQHGVHPAMAYAMMPMPVHPSEAAPVFVPQAVVPGNEKKFGSTTYVTVYSTTNVPIATTTTIFTVAG